MPHTSHCKIAKKVDQQLNVKTAAETRDKTLATDKDNLGQAAEEEVQGAGGVIKYLAFFR